MRAVGLVKAVTPALLALGLGAAPARAAGRERLPDPFKTVDGVLMTPAGFTARDFDLLLNYRAAIPPTLPAVETLLRRPAAIDSLLPALEAAIHAATPPRALRPERLWSWVGVPDSVSLRPRKPRAPHGGGAAADLIKPWSRDELAFLLREAPGLFRAAAEDTLRNPWELEIDRRRGERITDSVMALAARLPWGTLAQAARELEERSDALVRAVSKKGPERVARDLRGLRERAEMLGYPVAVGTSGNDVHHVSHGIVFDPGGDDRYVFPDTVRPGTWLLVIDAAGNDVYEARDTVGAAAGFLSAQKLVDLAGDDRYQGVDLAFGAGVLGYSALHDLAGDDVYEARCASLGFAFHGLGVLRDASGNDVYSSAYLSQAAATTRGLALLQDEAGDDRYLSRPVFPDDLRYRDHYLSLSQGFSTGFAPRHAGGIALLQDRAGNDAYESDIFGQGAGYWFGWGALVDASGNDTFKAHQYAQGAGVHFAAGTLIDRSGDDVRISKGVSQGCGHDGGFGLLADHRGDDSTTAVDMSAGAGSANGLGMFVDLEGSDVYDMAQPRRALGHADMRRDRGSFGFFLDLGGGRDTLPPEGGFAPGAARALYEGKLQGHGYGLDAE